MTGLHDDRCATLKGYPCNCAMAALFDGKEYDVIIVDSLSELREAELQLELYIAAAEKRAAKRIEIARLNTDYDGMNRKARRRSQAMFRRRK